MKSIGDRLYSWRHIYRLTQQDVADELGVSVRTIGRWERGEAVPKGPYNLEVLLLLQTQPASWRGSPAENRS